MKSGGSPHTEKKIRNYCIITMQTLSLRTMATKIVQRRVVVDLLFNVLPIVWGSSVFVIVLLCITLCPFWFCIHLEEKEKAARLLCYHCYYKCSVALPHGAIGWLVCSA